MRRKEIKYNRIAKKLIKNLPEFEYIRDSEVRISYLACDEVKIKDRKIVFADCTKVNSKYDWCCPYDFFITVYEPNCAEFADEQIEILMMHELHHVGIDQEGNEPRYYVVPHDVEEFWQIIEQYGLNWQEGKDANRG